MDNSVKALYEARKIESKLAQRKMLGIVTPAALSVEAIHRSFKSKSKSQSKGFKSQTDYTDCKFCGKSHDKGKCPTYGKVCNKCGRKNHFESKWQSSSKFNSDRPRGSKPHRKCGKCGHKKVDCVEYSQEESDESDSDSNGMKDLTEQVQSLFYH